ncbi:MAG: tRNA 2-thiocytidine(32) synthetase TtcA [Deltaproteobacteria bacterium]|nr:tRNA 2-thiocytidine(32) synthetase TtcA [Candidatus Zymogenaceae bacterium]
MSQIKKCEQALDSTVGRAVIEYSMIEANDRVLVAVSGGKDSWALLTTLMRLKKKAPIPFSLFAVHVDAAFPETEADTELIEACLSDLGVEHEILPTGIYQLMQMKVKPGSNPCGFCSRMRRGALYGRAKAGGFTKIALGHHREDAIETLLLNLFYAGQIRSLSPKYITDDGAHTVIRPMILTPEYKIEAYVREAGFPIIDNCPFHDKTTSRRASMRALVSDLKRENPRIVKSIMRALANVDPKHLLDKRLLDTGSDVDDDH